LLLPLLLLPLLLLPLLPLLLLPLLLLQVNEMPGSYFYHDHSSLNRADGLQVRLACMLACILRHPLLLVLADCLFGADQCWHRSHCVTRVLCDT
jgi:hypothetical protein